MGRRSQMASEPAQRPLNGQCVGSLQAHQAGIKLEWVTTSTDGWVLKKEERYFGAEQYHQHSRGLGFGTCKVSAR